MTMYWKYAFVLAFSNLGQVLDFFIMPHFGKKQVLLKRCFLEVGVLLFFPIFEVIIKLPIVGCFDHYLCYLWL